VLFALCVGNSTSAAAGEDSWIEMIAQDMGSTATAPLKLRRHPKAAGTLVAIGSLLIFSLDNRIDDHYSGSDSGGLFQIPRGMNRVGEFYDSFGTRNLVLSSAGLIALGGLVTRNEAYVRTAAIGIEAYVFTKFYTAFLKRMIARARPFTGKGPRAFSPFSYPGRDNQAMPSGHTSGIFSFVTVLAERHPSWWIRIPVFTFAASVAAQRMNSRNHWASDTLIGAALGYGVGKTLVSRHTPGSSSSGAPMIQPVFRGLALTYRFQEVWHDDSPVGDDAFPLGAWFCKAQR